MDNNTKLYYAAWTDSGFLLGCDHKHQTVTEAVDCASVQQQAGSFVVAVENGINRALNDVEETEFQRAPRKQPAPAVLEYEASGYAVMVRFRLSDSWTWTTWMRFDTYEQALAHARPNEKIVPFGSAEWHALHQSREPALLAPPILTPRSQARRREDETLMEYVSRLIPAPLDPRNVDEINLKDLETALPVANESPRPTFTELVLEWINNWEVKALEKIYCLLVSATGVISILRSRVQKTKSQQ
jgi:hypothetical protein